MPTTNNGKYYFPSSSDICSARSPRYNEQICSFSFPQWKLQKQIFLFLKIFSHPQSMAANLKFPNVHKSIFLLFVLWQKRISYFIISIHLILPQSSLICINLYSSLPYSTTTYASLNFHNYIHSVHAPQYEILNFVQEEVFLNLYLLFLGRMVKVMLPLGAAATQQRG